MVIVLDEIHRLKYWGSDGCLRGPDCSNIVEPSRCQFHIIHIARALQETINTRLIILGSCQPLVHHHSSLGLEEVRGRNTQ